MRLYIRGKKIDLFASYRYFRIFNLLLKFNHTVTALKGIRDNVKDKGIMFLFGKKEVPLQVGTGA